MIKWFKRLFRKEVVLVYSKPVNPWNEESSKGLKEFLDSKVGKLALEHLEGGQIASSVNACKPSYENRDYKAGIAFGRLLTLQHLVLLATPKAQNEADGLFLDDQSPSDSELEEAIQNRLNRLAKDDHLVL